MRIGEIAERTGLNISNVRFYERKGLLTPEREAGSKYRDYSEEDVNRIKKILLFTHVKFKYYTKSAQVTIFFLIFKFFSLLFISSPYFLHLY